MATDGGTKAVVAALLANTGIAATKFLAFFLTGISSMLAEAIHSVADAGNQLLLLLGGKQSRREATEEHPFGYGRERYIYAFIVSIVLFSVGGLFALYEAYHKFHEIQVGSPRGPGQVVVGPARRARRGDRAGVASRSARRSARRTRCAATRRTRAFVRHAKKPELPVILLEDVAALLGLAFALAGGVPLAHHGQLLLRRRRHRDDRPPARVVAIVLAIETKSLLLGEAASLDAQEPDHLRARGASRGSTGSST